MRRLALLSAFLALPGCVGPLRGLNPVRDRTLDGWCEGITRGQAYYSKMTKDLDAIALDSGWLLQYSLAKGVLELLGPKLMGDCENIAQGYDVDKEDIAWAVAESADSFETMVQLHEITTAPVVDPSQPLSFLSKSASAAMGSKIPHASLLKEIRLVKAEATAVIARAE